MEKKKRLYGIHAYTSGYDNYYEGDEVDFYIGTLEGAHNAAECVMRALADTLTETDQETFADDFVDYDLYVIDEDEKYLLEHYANEPLIFMEKFGRLAEI